MKRTDIEKNKGLQIKHKMEEAGAPARFGTRPTQKTDRREQRKLDQAQGLIPFAIKLNSELVKQIQELAQKRQSGLNEVVSELLQVALALDTPPKKTASRQ